MLDRQVLSIDPVAATSTAHPCSVRPLQRYSDIFCSSSTIRIFMRSPLAAPGTLPGTRPCRILPSRLALVDEDASLSQCSCARRAALRSCLAFFLRSYQ
jgi:hypothetical protein